jgi:hypothetical protein
MIHHCEMTEIEEALFLDGRAHWVCAFRFTAGVRLDLTLHPGFHPEEFVLARFECPHLIAVDDSHGDDCQAFPWDVIGFDAEPLAAGRWRFCMHTDQVEYTFESNWPEVQKLPVPSAEKRIQ